MKVKRINMDKVAITIIAVCVALIAAFELLSPGKIIERAVSKSISEYSSVENAISICTDDKIIEVINNDNISINAGITTLSGDYSGTGVELSVDRDMNNKVAQADIDINYKDTAAFALNAYAENDKVTLSSEELYDKNIALDINTVSRSVYDLLKVDYNEDDENLNVLFDTDINNFTYNAYYQKISSGIIMSANKAWRNISGNISLNKIPKEEVNGVKCKVYEIKISAEDTAVFFADFKEKLLADKNFTAGISGVAKEQAKRDYKANAFMYQLYGIDEQMLVDAYNNMLIDNITNIYDYFITNTNVGDATLRFYINGGRLIKGHIATFTTVEDDQLDINLVAEFNGTEKPTDSLNAYASLLSKGLEYKVQITDTNNFDGTTYNNKKTLLLTNTYDVTAFNLNTTYNKDTGEFTALLNQDTNDEILLEINGKGTIENNKGYVAAAVDELKVFESGNEVFNGEGYFNIAPLEEEITPIEGETVDFSALSEEEKSTEMQKVYENINKVLAEFEG